MALLAIRGGCLTLGSKCILDDASLFVEEGERLCIVGRNGVGKSTILNRVVKHLLTIDRLDRTTDGVLLSFYPEESTGIDFDVIRSFDRPVLSGEFLNKVTELGAQEVLIF